MNFNEEFFFNLILPPIIFSAGYNLKNILFIKNFLYIFLFGFIGPLISFGLIVFGIKYFNQIFSGVDLTVSEIYLFSCVLSCTEIFDSISFVKPHNEPKLYSIIKGSSIINYAVSVVLFESIDDYSLIKSNIGK